MNLRQRSSMRPEEGECMPVSTCRVQEEEDKQLSRQHHTMHLNSHRPSI